MLSILKRFLKVLYVLLLVFGLLVGWFVWNLNVPYNTYSYVVKCDNGKVFDPESKPINSTGKSSYSSGYIDNTKLFDFDQNQIKAECIYGRAASDWQTYNLPKNYVMDIIKHNPVTLKSQIISTVETMVIYYIGLEILRRTFIYIFLGKPFFKTKSKLK